MPETNAKPLMVNLGCGMRYHRAWRNYDLQPASSDVIAANFIDGIPLPDDVASALYHSHVLEHLPREIARRFLLECRRVLMPGGILRIVVPDLEQSAREYIAVLDARRRGEDRKADHEWMLVELLDQMVRSSPGGQYETMLRVDRGNDAFLLPRLGGFGEGLLQSLRKSTPGRPSLKRRVFNTLTRMLPRRLGESMQEARFRRAGEIHLWMYDELSLRDLLIELGFTDVQRMTAQTSSIPDFAIYALDVDPDNKPWKGVSLYMEARKP
jgi:hypothetical protein